jgi:hypothetical protein
MQSSLIAVVTLALAAASLVCPAQAARQSRYASQDAARTLPDGTVKPGTWEFAAKLQHQGGGGLAATYRMCVDQNRPVPSGTAPNCKIEGVARNGQQITWAMVCTNAETTIHSDGAAEYHGETMDATLVNHVPRAEGKLIDITQRITGRYLGPCPETAAMPAAPAAPNVATNEAAGTTIEPPPAAHSGSTPVPPAAVTAPAAPRAQQGAHYVPQRRYARRHHRYYAGGYGPPNILALPFMALRGVFGR